MNYLNRYRCDQFTSPSMSVCKLIAATLSSWLLIGSGLAMGAEPALLADAVEKADGPKLEALLQQKIAVNAQQVDGMTALHWAAYRDDLKLVKRLIAAGASAKSENRYGVTPLSFACTNGNAEMVQLLLDNGADPKATLPGGETALMTAARTGVVEPVKALLARGADVNAKERKGQTALMWAAAEGQVGVVKELLASGADFRTPLGSGFTPLFFAVREGRKEVVQILLDAGADVNEVMRPRKPGGKAPQTGTSPLIMAIENGHFEVASLLLDKGADANDERTGYGPLHTLTWVRNPNRGDGDDGQPPPIGSGRITSLQFVKVLMDHGADVNLRLKKGPSGKGVLGKVGATAFLMAAATGDAPLMQSLIDLGADPLLSNAEHTTPLLAAAGVGVNTAEETAGTEPEVLEAVALALKLGGDINAVNDNGETAMHGAAYRNHPKVAQFLADHGAQIAVWNQKNKYGWTPLAIGRGHRFGNFKPSAETVAALSQLMLAAGAPIPDDVPPLPPSNKGYAEPKKAVP
jgi:uncharacterized protein